ncbi:hypothetical protein BDB00DRAFT_784793 [Zychaea mexicana]|uniref:uncharacterized protein n=1 Tax=Zychaea mexicana TaxID=64656 RepID=UPI0022FED240|nr:uncharacterized protein BDB00DRAFT_784793 [Zychaea mexicana]KAI9497462.1 hypothetical protein BDB00DRAFT_784793 [Zychaea mexicana]
MSSRIVKKRKQTTTVYKVSEKGAKIIKLVRNIETTTANDNITPFEVRQTQSANVDPQPTQCVDTDDEDDDVDGQPRRQSAAAKRAVRWAGLFPGLVKAYKEGYKQAPVPEALEPVEAAMCGCDDDKKASKEVTCIFKCVLMRRHMFPLTPQNPGHAVHIKLMQTIHNLHYICRVSVHSIAKWAEADFEEEVPASFKSRLNDALPVFDRTLLSLKKQPCVYTYVLSVLKKVTDTKTYGSNIRIMYDVDCKLRSTLKRLLFSNFMFFQKKPSLRDIEDAPIAVGIFLITGHNFTCQVHFHPRLVKGFGMIDGEWLIEDQKAPFRKADCLGS